MSTSTPGYVKLLVPEHLYVRALHAIGALEAEPSSEPTGDPDNLADRIAMLSAALALVETQRDESVAENARLRAELERERVGASQLEDSVTALREQLAAEQERLLNVLPVQLEDRHESPEPEPAVDVPEREPEHAAPEPEPLKPGTPEQAQLVRDLAPAAPVQPTPAPVAKRPYPKQTPTLEGLTAADRDQWADKFVSAVMERKPDALLLSSALPDLYAEWAEFTDAPAIAHRWLGAAMRKAGYESKLKHYPEQQKSAQTYFDVAPRKMTAVQTEQVRKMIDANRPKRVENKDEEPAPAPVITPKLIPQKTTPPILHVKNHEQAKDSNFAGVRVIKANGVVTTVDAMVAEAPPDATPIKPEDADGTTFDLWTDVKSGCDRPFEYLPEVLALQGLDKEAVETAVRKPQHVEIRPESREKKYPVLAFRRGDIQVVMGFRDRLKPAVIACYWRPLLEHDHHVVNRHGGGGARKSTGLPTTVKAAVTQLQREGLTFPDTWESATSPVEVSYRGKVLSKMKVHLSNKTQIQSDYQRLLRQKHAVDRREGAAV